jgi:hypothetical protein
MAITIPTPTVPLISNPVTGVFGTGLFQIFAASGTFTVPFGIVRVRARVWGAGGISGQNTATAGSGGGGFAMKVVDVGSVSTVAVTVGVAAVNVTGGTSSFGSFVSATGGVRSPAASVTATAGGTGVGGDINFTGGIGAESDGTNNGGSGGVAGVFGNGGDGVLSTNIASRSRNTGGGAVPGSGIPAGVGLFGLPTTLVSTASLDFIGTGAGSATLGSNATNGGGGPGGNGVTGTGGYPGGGGSATASGSNFNSYGLVIVEY